MLAVQKPTTQSGYVTAGEQEKKPKPLPQPSGTEAPQPNAQPQTFATLQRQGFARPAPPAPQPQAPQSPASSPQAPQAPQTQQVTPGGAIPQPQSYPAPVPPTAPANFSPLNYMVEQVTGQQPTTNFASSAGGVNFQNYTPGSAPSLATPEQIAVQGGGGGVNASYNAGNVGGGVQNQFTPEGTPVANATESKIMQLLDKPSGWDSDLVKSLYGTQGAAIDDEFDANDVAINEEMARRGLYDSSIAAGRLKDSNIGRRSAKTSLADSLLQQMGLNYGNDQARAASIGAGYEGQRFGQDATTFNTNQGAEQQAFGQRATQEQLNQGAAGMNQAGQIANSNAGIAQMNAYLQAAQANASNQLTRNNQELDSARFNSDENRFATTTANNNSQQRFANTLTAGQQDFNNTMSGLERRDSLSRGVEDYGQQVFNNDMTLANLNRTLSNDEWDRLIQTLGLR